MARTKAVSATRWAGKADVGRYIAVAVLVAIFATTLVLRWDHLDNPMGLHHEEGTARTLVHSAAWWEDGPSSGGYLLRTTLTSPGDKFLGSGDDEEGNAYYYSFPPGHPLWAFLVHRAIGVEPTVMSVRVFNLILNVISFALVYLIVVELLRKLPKRWSRTAGIFAAAAYAHAPIVLWYQSNAYTTASAVQPLFLGALYALVRAYRAEARPWMAPAVLGGLVFLASYTEWLGFAFAGVAVAMALIRRDDRVLRRVAIAAASGAAAALVLVVAQYATQLGLGGVFEVFADRLAIRSGTVDTGGYTFTNPASWLRLGGIYRDELGSLLVGAFALWALDRWAGRGKSRHFAAGDAPIATVLVLALVPVVVHHVLLFNHAVIHDFDVLKTSVFLSLAIGVLTARLIARYAAGEGTSERTAITRAGLVVLAVVLAGAYLFLGVNAKVYPEPKALGEAIAAAAQPEEVVFLTAPVYVPPSITKHYSGRNYLEWSGDMERTRQILQRSGPRTGILLLLNDQIEVIGTGYVGTDAVVYETRDEARETLSAPAE